MLVIVVKIFGIYFDDYLGFVGNIKCWGFVLVIVNIV